LITTLKSAAQAKYGRSEARILGTRMHYPRGP
jgi:hypothetical protein